MIQQEISFTTYFLTQFPTLGLLHPFPQKLSTPISYLDQMTIQDLERFPFWRIAKLRQIQLILSSIIGLTLASLQKILNDSM